MSWLLTFSRSTVGAKAIMALTGAAMYGFLIVHMAGNLLVFSGTPELHNHHSVFLHSFPELIWPARAGLLLAIVAHIFSWVNLRMRSSAARPVAYKVKQSRASTLYSRTMQLSGPVILVFVVVHLLNLTSGNIHPGFRMQGAAGAALPVGVPGAAEAFGSPAAYENTVALLSQPLWGVFYIVANLLLGLHLFHGGYAMCRTLGLSGERQQGLAKLLASGVTALIVGGNVAIAAAILLGLVK
ncbi:MAG: succinate dehydrogenase cytochrome b subunit [Pseudomonadota bacterium]|nr:succinate dehydrogenase cytochrome b subunit [Pseudomonadota bacterium]